MWRIELSKDLASSLMRLRFCVMLALLYGVPPAMAVDQQNTGAWEGFPRSMPNLRYEEDDAANWNHPFGVGKAFSPYVDPPIADAFSLQDPLQNPNFGSYSLIVIVNKSSHQFWGPQQTMRIYQRGKGLLYYWFISTGIKGFETPSGYYRPTMFSSRHWSTIYQVPMLWAAFFHGGMALHSSLDRESLTELGHKPSSHGCVHVEEYRAEELFHLVGHSGYGSVDVINRMTGRKTGKKVRSYKTLIIVSPIAY